MAISEAEVVQAFRTLGERFIQVHSPALATFLSGMQHDLNNAVGALIGEDISELAHQIEQLGAVVSRVTAVVNTTGPKLVGHADALAATFGGLGALIGAGVTAGIGAGAGAVGVSAPASTAQIDAANRRALQSQIQQLKEQVGADWQKLQQDGLLTDQGRADEAQIEGLLKKLAGLEGIQGSLSGPQGAAPRYLLQFDTDGPNGGHAVISIGNPATAHNVTTFVPGMGSNTAKIGGDLGYAQNIENAADRASGSQNATVVWLGYDAPQGFDVTSPDLARQGAPALSTFLADMKANNPDAHYVVEGHSYGSVVVGYAAQQPDGLSASDVILVGSPGTPAASASDFGVQNGHLWVGERGGDPVPAAGDVGGSGHGPLGNDPVDIPGAVHIDVGNANPLGYVNWGALNPFDLNPLDHIPVHDPLQAHSQYWDQGPQIDNQGRIIAGHYGDVTTVG